MNVMALVTYLQCGPIVLQFTTDKVRHYKNYNFLKSHWLIDLTEKSFNGYIPIKNSVIGQLNKPITN